MLTAQEARNKVLSGPKDVFEGALSDLETHIYSVISKGHTCYKVDDPALLVPLCEHLRSVGFKAEIYWSGWNIYISWF